MQDDTQVFPSVVKIHPKSVNWIKFVNLSELICTAEQSPIFKSTFHDPLQFSSFKISIGIMIKMALTKRGKMRIL